MYFSRMTNVKISEEGRKMLQNQRLSRSLLKAITSHAAGTPIQVVAGGRKVLIRSVGSISPANVAPTKNKK